jgi:antitoxin component YwqK of YwqJK toxin-antitoxin module
MKSLIFILIFVVTPSYGQIEVELYFRDGCDNSLRKLEYEIVDLNKPTRRFESTNSKVTLPVKGLYLVSSSYSKGDKVSEFDLKLEINDVHFVVDTLSIPRIKFTTNNEMHSAYWNYFNCDNLCNGEEIDFYPNGQKRIEGDFREGKPVRLVEYRNDGTRERAIWYKIGYLEYERIEYFDKEGKMTAYATFRKDGNEIIKRVYDSKGTLLNREVVNQNN